jgi:hypothetical protein
VVDALVAKKETHMAQHPYIEHVDRRSGLGTGVIVGAFLVLIVGVVALFLYFGGPGRLIGGTAPTAPSTTNVNVAPPAQAQPQVPPQINIPREIDINLNQPPAQVPVTP